MVPVVVSTALSTKDSVPVVTVAATGGSARTAGLPAPVALDEAEIRGGTAKRTRMGRIWLIVTSGVASVAADQIPLPDHEAPGPARDRRADGGVLEVEPRLVHRGASAASVRLPRPRRWRGRSYCWAVTYSFFTSSAYRCSPVRRSSACAPSRRQHCLRLASAAWKGRGSIWKSI